MHLSLLTFSLLTSLSPTILVSAYPIKADGVNCRSGPGTSFSVKQTYARGKDISITCQTTGTAVKGNNIWDKTPDNCYVADYYVKTGKDGFVTKKCEEAPKPSSPKPNKLPGPIKNDYPYKNSCSANKGIDPWNYFRCNCTSFVAWRINKRLGIKFHNKWRGADWGNANEWDEAAKKSKVKINKTPKVGSIAQTNAGKKGHVAWVVAVNKDKGTVTVEEYNWNTDLGYGKRTVDKGKFQHYIHLELE
ncbi:CHAP-domain-containing protein [Rhypophila decipiens]|uniref:CHAP-domain-containing protein n=1 Tax=Rhypophila decipiens TaxID=261697 RepID=A0AAN6Y2U5_9PEZI|nr:CHAP-domain-containing protein [Rhypophila decipiens]